ncbi:MAG TPA: ABC transporter permease [Steroidobacteraceae bacterium]|jgi:ABC-2 type transport system permease protein
MSLNIHRIGLVAARDYKAVITSRGFLIGLLIMPVMLLIVFVLAPRMLNSRSPQIVGEVAVVDPTSKMSAELQRTLTPADIARRRALEGNQNRAPANGPGGAAPAAAAAAQTAAAPIPVLTLKTLPVDTDVQTKKSWLIQDRGALPRHLAIVVIKPDAVIRRADSKSYGSFDLYTSSNIEDSTESVLRDGIRAGLIAARLRSNGLDPTVIATAQQVTQPDSVVVAAAGEHSGSRGIARLLPMACGILVFVGVIMGGQILMTSTVEEKSNRVIEVLLAAVSPQELMYGKLLGGLGLGLTMTAVYIVLALYALAQFSLAGLLDPMLIVYLLAFYVATYMVFGSLMLVIGAAVDQMADAQSLLGPTMILMVVGYLMTPVISAAPNSTFSVAMSFTPFVNTFAMLARVASISPPPAWEVGLTLLISCATAAVVVWFAGKVFKIALLMHGKPPSLGTLVKWARTA